MAERLVLAALIALFEGCMFLCFFRRMYAPRVSFAWLAAADAVYAAGMVAMQAYIESPIITMVASIGLTLCIASLFDMPVKMRVFYSFMMFFLGALCEVISGFIFSDSLPMLDTGAMAFGASYVTAALSSKLMFFLVVLVILRFMTRRDVDAIPAGWFCVLLAIPVTSIAALVALALNLQNLTDPLAVSIIILGFVVANISIFWANDASNGLLHRLLQANREHDALARDMQQARALVVQAESAYQRLHDVERHYVMVYRLIDECHHEDAKTYLTALCGDIKTYRSQHTITNVPAVDLLLRSKQREAQDKGIDIRQKVALFQCDALNGVALCVFLNNALDNAIEACEHVDGERRIRVMIHQTQRQVFVDILNSSQPVHISDGMCKTSKADTRVHGYGLKSMHSIAEDIGGHCTIRFADGMFELRAVFALRPANYP